ncbi:MAG: chorismate synthase [Epsilonproteobacteria bacterium]|nr:chorismate synthase [Campylobacterota bacterium]NPA57596.1 chorismate synthase [Campylobacterota bacterium]
MNSFGLRFRFTTFGESHGRAIGTVVDGVPAGLKIDEEFIQKELERRRPGQNKFTTARKESDRVEILSGVLEGVATGTPIAMVIFNRDQRSRDYSAIKELFRPGHADFTYQQKYGIRDYRGGGRSSARETAARVAAGAVAKLLLREFDIEVEAGVAEVAGIEGRELNFDYARSSEIMALDPQVEGEQKEAILKAKEAHDSVGGCVIVRARGVPPGLGEPIYYKLDAVIAEAMMGINAVKGVEIGAGREAAAMRGSDHNDQMGREGFLSNRAGGILGGISNGEEILVKVWFKPTPSIFQRQRTINLQGEEVSIELQGRHDPFVAARGAVVAEAMMALVLADMLLLGATSRLQSLKKVYNG